jgi:hypothetical protein
VRHGIQAIGISVHTGWGACVVVSGSAREPSVAANAVVELVSEPNRFCYHRAVEMDANLRESWLAQLRLEILGRARDALGSLVTAAVRHCAVVGKAGEALDLEEALVSHMKIHAAEGLFYRDIFIEASPIPVQIVPPTSLDLSQVRKLPFSPWGRDQKLAALAAWSVLKKQ